MKKEKRKLWKYSLIGGAMGLIMGVILDFTLIVYFTIFWRAFLGDTLIARQISWVTLPLLFLIMGILIGRKKSKVKR